MAIITISRELAALGDETACELAKLLDYKLVDRDILEKKIKIFGIEDKNFKKYDERKPGFWASLSQDRDNYLHYLKTAMLSEVGAAKSAVIVGRGASAILKNVPGVLSVFLVVPIEVRIERVKSYFHCNEKRARQIIEKSDSDRSGFYHYFFDTEWRNPENYHLTVNTGHLHPAVCAEIIKRLRDYFITEKIEERQVIRIKELTLAHKIKHHILYDKELPVHFLEVSVSENKITLYGVANSQVLVDATVSTTTEFIIQEKVVLSVRSEIQVIQEYSIVP
ncbi:MAG: cytidylate kinase-like family protein [Treponema sp.]|jgi:cytidylate kinase|nr:cytidylate kinase-like family protein [Treponema sp.]